MPLAKSIAVLSFVPVDKIIASNSAFDKL